MLPTIVTLSVTMLLTLAGVVWRFSALVARLEETMREHKKLRSEWPRMKERLSLLEAAGGRRKSGGDFD